MTDFLSIELKHPLSKREIFHRLSLEDKVLIFLDTIIIYHNDKYSCLKILSSVHYAPKT